MPAPRLPFTDTISLTHSIDCLRAGYDPYLTGRCDPWGRKFNYPPVWLQLKHLSISGKSTQIIGVAMAALTTCAMLLCFRTRSPQGLIIALLALLSPAVVFGMERGNVDTLLFSILVFGLFIARRAPANTRRRLLAGLVVGLTTLKIYPIAAVVALGRYKRDLGVAVVVVGISAAVLAMTSWDRLGLILENTPLTSSFSYGSAALFLDLREFSPLAKTSPSHLRWIASATALAVGVVAFVAAAFHATRASTATLSLVTGRKFVDDLFLASLAIFCFSFLLGSNFNYRLIFLTGVLPKLIDSFDRRRSRAAMALAALIISLLWAVYLPAPANYFLQWTMFTFACALIGYNVAEPWDSVGARSRATNPAQRTTRV